MGKKGAKLTPQATKMAEWLVDELASLGEVTARKQFGGYGIYQQSVMFAIVDSNGDAYLRADATTQKRFEAAGSERHGRMPYWAIPTETLSAPDTLRTWADEATKVAHANKKKR